MFGGEIKAMTQRVENDSMGAVHIPDTAYYGAQTQRALDNFKVSGQALPPLFIRHLALLKKCAAMVHLAAKRLPAESAGAIIQAADEVIGGALADQFGIDIFQTGSGTSTNMNMNEVLASRANEILTGQKGGRSPVHPNDHVNMGQSSNDVIPSVIHLASLAAVTQDLVPALEGLEAALAQKAEAFKDLAKMGRTHLQDAVPVTLGQEFSGYAHQVRLAGRRIKASLPELHALALGGTAVGTGLNAPPDFAAATIRELALATGWPLTEAENHFQAQACQDGVVALSGVLKALAVGLTKIANDLRWLASGPRCGLGEINLPALQPGSSIMPGKVNPVIPEMVIQVAAQVIGNDTAIALGGQGGYFELNTMLPLIAHNILSSTALLASAARLLNERCVTGITPNLKTLAANTEKSLALTTALVPALGYDKAAALSKQAYETGHTIRELAVAQGLFTAAELVTLLGPDRTIDSD
jgi:fumarate hydratase class II